MSRESRFAALVIAGLAFVSTAPAFAWTPTSWWAAPPWESPGNVTFTRPPVTATSFSALGMRSLGVSPMYVYSMWGMTGIPQTAVADMQVWRSNGTSWVKFGPIKRVQSAIPTNAYGVLLPVANVNLPYGGRYTVTVQILWWSYGGWKGYRTYSFNSASDYLPFGAPAPYLVPGGIYIP